MKQKTPVFWGCTLTHNYPFLIKSMKKVMEETGIDPTDVPGFGCCPDPVYIRTYGRETTLPLSARNLALAQKEGRELIVACNGCYGVLHEAQQELEDEGKRKEVNEVLPEELRYPGGLKVTHLVKTLSSKTPLIKTLIRRPLSNIRVAVHYGCHMLYPPAVETDDPGKPSSIDDLVKATGAESIEYESKLDCCGISVAAFDKEEADGLLQKKLSEIREKKADCIVTSCPACFMRLDMPPAELRELALPVLHISELLALAMGASAQDMFLAGHATKTDRLMEKIDAAAGDERKLIEKNFNLDELASHCTACREECTAAVTSRDSEKPFDPLWAVDELLSGNLYGVLESPEIWRCLQCGKCLERCPNNTGLREFYARLRELAVKRNAPRAVADKMCALRETGCVMPKRKGIRRRMGIEDAPDIDSGAIREILDKTKGKEK